MGLRGPKPGYKLAKAKAQKAEAKRAAAPTPPAGSAADGVPTVDAGSAGVAYSDLSAAQRANPKYLTGANLRELAFRSGMARSQVADMPDEKIREQLRYLEARRFDTAEA